MAEPTRTPLLQYTALTSARTKQGSIPPEVWQKIFRFVVQLPGAHSYTDVDGFIAFTRDQYGACAQTRFKAVMRTKLSISLVCSTWKALISRHMFEYLLIESGKQAILIADVFKAKHASNDDPDRAGGHPGWWATRLEIALDRTHMWTKEHSTALVYIIKSCPNLTCFSTAFCDGNLPHPDSSSIIAALTESCNIKRIELKTDLPSLEAIATALSPSLEMIWLVPSRQFCEDKHRWTCSLPKVHTFVSHFQFGHTLDHLELPSLRTVVVGDSCDRSAIIHKNGRWLRYLSVSDLALTLPLLSACHNLLTLAINFHEITLRNFAIALRDTTFSNVQCLIIEAHNDIDLSRWFSTQSALQRECLRNNLLLFASTVTFPNLRSVRLVLPLSFEAMSYNPFARHNWRSIWDPWLKACNKRGITVETAHASQQWSTNKWQPFRIAL